MSIERRWNRNKISRESPDKEVNRRPTSLNKFRADAYYFCYYFASCMRREVLQLMLSVCMSFRSRIYKNTRINFIKFSVRYAYTCDVTRSSIDDNANYAIGCSPTFGFVDNVKFAHNGPADTCNGNRTHMHKVTHLKAAPGSEVRCL